MGDLHRLGGATSGELIRAAAVRAVLLSLLFFVVYGGTNWLTSLRSDVATWYFDWESQPCST